MGSPFALPEFVAGPENRLVEVAVSAVLGGPTEMYNPMVIYGPTGTGKSHLACGLFQAWKAANPRKPAVLITGADFAREHREAAETKTEDQFSAPYDRARLLVLDNLDQLGGRPAAQQALTRIVDRMLASAGWVVMTSRVSPARLPGTQPALQARLSGGLMLRLALPELETRIAILDRIARLRRIRVAREVLQALAEGLTVPVPELIGALIQLEGEARLEGAPLSLEAAERLVAVRRDTRCPNLSLIAKTVSKHFGFSVAQLRGASRQKALVSARNVAMYLSKKLTGSSFERIGVYFGNRDHTTVSHGCRKIEQNFNTDSTIREAVVELEARLLLR